MIDFSGYSREAIQRDMLVQVSRTIDTREGSLIQTAVGPAAWYLEGLYMLLEQVQRNAYADTAVGKCLDYICAERGVPRKSAVPAVRRGLFNVRVPEGSAFKTMNGAESVVFTAGPLVSETSNGFEYELTCAAPGVLGNAYVGNLLPVTVINGLTSAAIGSIVTPGAEEEEDDSLRARYMATFDVANFGGNIAAYRNTILAMSGVGAVQVYPSWKGGGTVLCSILGEDLKPASQAIVHEVQRKICPKEENGEVPAANGYGMAPIGAAVTITTGSELTLNITCDIEFISTLQNGVEIYQETIREKIQEYLNEVNATWGNALKSQAISYPVTVYRSRIIFAILTIPDVVNVSGVTINGSGDDLQLVETAQLQQVPVLGMVVIHGE